MVQLPVSALAEFEYLAKQFLALAHLDEDILQRRMLVAETGRNGHALDTQLLGVIQKPGDFLSAFALEQGAVDRHTESLLDRQFDHFDRAIEDAALAD